MAIYVNSAEELGLCITLSILRIVIYIYYKRGSWALYDSIHLGLLYLDRFSGGAGLCMTLSTEDRYILYNVYCVYTYS